MMPEMAPEMTPNDLTRIHGASFVMPAPWPARDFADFLASPLCFVETDGASGFILGRVIADEAELLTIATHPAHQRQGLARQVMQDWQDLARTRGAAEAFLEVAADNTPAQALYQACGFATCGTRPGYYARKGAAPVDAVLMRCSLR